MPCLCGDTACPSCGPAQGYDLKYEVVCDWLYDICEPFPEMIDGQQMVDFILSKIGSKAPAELVTLLEVTAADYFYKKGSENAKTE